jgi:hypothetical protein
LRRVAATIYHLFLAEDNSAELFNQLKRIHSLFPYSIVKNVMRFANPISLFPRILDIFMAQPFGNRSLLQHMFGMAIQEGINNIQKSITVLITQRIHEPDFPQVIQRYVEADDIAKAEVKSLAFYEDIDIVYAVIKKSQDAEWCTDISLSHDQLALADEAYAAWRQAVEHVGSERTAEAELYAHLKQLMKLNIRQRDKVKMLEMINEVRKTPHSPSRAGAVRFVIVMLALCNYLDLAEELLWTWYYEASGQDADDVALFEAGTVQARCIRVPATCPYCLVIPDRPRR